MAKTLLDLRIEKGLYLKDVAEKTGIPEEELRAIEESGTVPPDIAEILINDYCLTDTYFTVEEVGKLTPQKPMKYFFKVSLIWSVIVAAIAAIPVFIISICAVFFSEGMQVYNIITDVGGFLIKIISIVSGVFLVNYILKKTTFKGNIRKYQFLYPLLPESTVMFLSMISSWITFAWTSKMADDSFVLESPYFFVFAGAYMIMNFVSAVGVFVVPAYLCAKMLDGAVNEDENERVKFFRVMATLVTISLVISMVIYIVRSVTEDFQLLLMIKNLIGYVVGIIVAWAVALIKTDNKKIETVVYTVLPILAMIL